MNQKFQRTIKLFAIIVLIFIVSCKDDSPKKIAFMGDSITIGNKNFENYPTRIQSKLTADFGEKYIVGNFAVSGRTMLRNGDHPLWNEPQFSASIEFKPDIVYIMLGTNDSKPQNWDVSGEEFKKDYEAMIDTFLVINPKTKFILALPPPAFSVKWGIRDSVIVNGVIPVVKQLSEKYKTVIINYYEPLISSRDLFPDDIHPNSEGSEKMANLLYDRIIETSILK